MKTVKCVKKWIGIAVAALLLFSAIPVFAESNTVQISSDAYQINGGECFEITITYGGNFSGVDMRIGYNQDLLDIEDEASGIKGAVISDSNGVVYMNAIAIDPITALNGNMFSVKFKAKDDVSGDAGIQVRIEELFLNDENYNPVNLEYQVTDQITRYGGISIQKQGNNVQKSETRVKTSNGETIISGLSDNSSVSMTDQTNNQEKIERINQSIAVSEPFQKTEKTELLAIYDINAGDATFVNGKGEVSIPLSEEQKGYDTYYVGQEVDGKIVWSQAQVKDGNVVFTTDHLGEVEIVGVNGNNKVSGVSQGENTILGLNSSWTVIAFVIAILLIGGIVFFLLRRKRNDYNN